MKKLSLIITVFALFAGSAMAQALTGNEAPNGAHYNLNIIGVAKDKAADMTGTQGHTIFVPLWGKAQILLAEGPEFEVLDRNGTDGDGARFQLPNPDPDGDGVTLYSVYARALGKPGGKASMTTCAYWDNPDTGATELVCSMAVLELERTKGPQKFENVTKQLLYIYADYDDDGVLERVPLFSTELEDYFWDYDNKGLKLAQLRFYEIPTDVNDQP